MTGKLLKQMLSGFLVLAFIILSVDVFIPKAYADEARLAAWFADKRKPTALAQHKSTTKKRKNVESPDKYAPDQKIDQTVQQLTQKITMAMAPLQSIMGTMNGLSSVMNGAMGKIGGFTSGLSAISSVVSENGDSYDSVVSCPLPSVAPAAGQPSTGKLLASPVVGMRAMPIAGGGNACEQGSEVPCDEEDYKDNSQDTDSPSEKSPFRNPAPNGNGLE